jgi:hypothetical protein
MCLCLHLQDRRRHHDLLGYSEIRTVKTETAGLSKRRYLRTVVHRNMSLNSAVFMKIH